MSLAAEHVQLCEEVARHLLRRLPAAMVDREELVGSAALALVEAEQSFDPTRGVPFRAWAWRRATHRIVDELRHDHGRQFQRVGMFVSLEEPHGEAEGATLAQALPSPIDVAEHVEAREELRAVLELPARERGVLLRQAAGSLHAETAEVLGISKQGVDRIARKARNQTTANGRVDTPKLARAELTPPELEALVGAAHGESTQETAGRLLKAMDTVKMQRRSVIAKLRARNMMHAVYLASSKGLI